MHRIPKMYVIINFPSHLQISPRYRVKCMEIDYVRHVMPFTHKLVYFLIKRPSRLKLKFHGTNFFSREDPREGLVPWSVPLTLHTSRCNI